MKKNRKLPPDKFGPPPSHLLKQMENVAYGGVAPGISVDPKDHIWRGFQGDLDTDAMFDENRDPNGALKQILMAIILRNPNRTLKSSDTERLDVAFSALVGKKRKSGTKKGDTPYDKSKIIEDAAREYFWRSLDESRGKTDWKSCIEASTPPEYLSMLRRSTKGSLANFCRDIMDEIRPIEDQLLLAVSAHDLPQWQWREQRIAKVLNDLRILGVISQDTGAHTSQEGD
jgi:hypothetical protein